MNVRDRLSTPDRSLTWLLVLSLLFVINDRLIKWPRLETWTWDNIRLSLFFLDGACQHSGNCCKHLMLYRQGKAVKTARDFQALKTEQPTYRRFIPTMDKHRIHAFSCRCLTPDNWCNDYDNRPTVCRNYPLSNYILGDELYQGCGYRIARTSIKAPPWSAKLNRLIKEYELKVAL